MKAATKDNIFSDEMYPFFTKNGDLWYVKSHDNHKQMCIGIPKIVEQVDSSLGREFKIDTGTGRTFYIQAGHVIAKTAYKKLVNHGVEIIDPFAPIGVYFGKYKLNYDNAIKKTQEKL